MCLREQHPDRGLPNYDASMNNVLSIKLEILHQTIPASAPSPFVQWADSGDEQILVQNDEDLEEHDGTSRNNYDLLLGGVHVSPMEAACLGVTAAT